MQEYKLWKSISEHDDREAFDRLYLSFWEQLYVMTNGRIGDQDVAKDLVQEVFVSIWEKRKKIQIKDSVSQYLMGAMKYRILDYFQSEKVKQQVLERAFAVMEQVSLDHQFYLSYDEVERILEDELDKMPHNMKASFVLKMNNTNVKEIASQLDLADQTVSNLLSEATKRLKKSLPQRFESPHSLFIVGLIQVVNDLLTKN